MSIVEVFKDELNGKMKMKRIDAHEFPDSPDRKQLIHIG